MSEKSLISTPGIQIVDDQGSEVNPNRINPNVMSFIMLSAIAGHSAKIERHLKDLEGKGMTRLIPVSVSQKTKKLILPEVWQSVSIVNDGDSTVYVRINSMSAPKIPLNQGETFDQDFKTHKLSCLYFNCGQGESTSLRVVGNY